MKKQCRGKCENCRVVTENPLVASLRLGSFVRIECRSEGKVKRIPIRKRKSGQLTISV